ncbi:MAG: flavohemoglobin expression-modulating QEGLA motif protein [Pseudomonadota bacterium]|nr:flavohemoglobin expression-modulating QEGLA motif protein [Pseudomonadota bacterium]
MTIDPSNWTKEHEIIADLSARLVECQRPIRILDTIKWDDSIKQDFFASGCQKLPEVTPEYYSNRVLSYDLDAKIKELDVLSFAIQNHLGKLSPLSQLLQRMCHEYIDVIHLLQARGTKRFGDLSRDLFGSASEAFYIGGPSLCVLAEELDKTLPNLLLKATSAVDEKKYTALEAAQLLREQLAEYFNDPTEQVSVEISNTMIADAAAGAEVVMIKGNTLFSERDIRNLLVHEGWVHLGTTLNGRRQPVCTFLSKGTPSSTITQEGLALITEVFTFSAYPARIKRMCNRIDAVDMVEQGADFIQVFQHLLDKGLTQEESYQQTVRVFRGALPDGSCGAFTKDVSYTKGFVIIYNYIILAIKYGQLEQIPLLFTGKTTLQDIPLIQDLIDHGFVEPPKYMPPQFRDLAALSSWMSFSTFMHSLDIDKMEMDYKAILRI